ncbi:DUF6197 family protein [Frondihabitans cladoniiphilus]|uniref:Uncharacterized protein n=1 Tax=Frondihabitans cladoniiphilus TaxID=715785 RepID=A0ABP8W4M0_9MICO
MTTPASVLSPVEQVPDPTPLAGPVTRVGPLGRWFAGLRARRSALAERRRAEDVARLADLLPVLASARDRVEAGWIQNAWFETVGPTGGRMLATGMAAFRVEPRDVTGSCLVGALVLAAGGPAEVQSPVVRDAVAATWHALHRADGDPFERAHEPIARARTVRDLTGWNDDPGRSAEEVTELLLTAERMVSRELLASGS